MGLNLAEIQQKLDRLIQNMSEQNRRAYQIFYDPTPQDVTLPQLDENGNLVNVTIPNRAKIKAQVDNFIAGAETNIKGWWVQNYNVSSIDELVNAINDTPFGGLVNIYLQNDITIDRDIDISGKQVFIHGDGHKLSVNTFKVKDTNNTVVGTGIFNIHAVHPALIHFHSITIDLPAISSTGNGNQWFWNARRVFIQLGNPNAGIGFYGCAFAFSTINVGDNVYVVGRGNAGTNNYPANGFVIAGTYGTTVNLDPDGDGSNTGNGFSINVQEII